MNELQVINNDLFGNIRLIEKSGEVWFVAADVCKALEILNTSDALTKLDSDEKMTIDLTEGQTGRGGPKSLNIVNESGLYTLVMRSRKPEAKEFRRWVTHDVLPSLHKTGKYEMDYMKQQRLKEEAENILSLINADNWKFVEEGLAQRFNISHLLLPSAETNLTAKLIVTDEKDKWAIDNAMKAYGEVYEYYRTTHDDRKIREYVNLPGNQWLSTIGSAILNSALFIGRKAHIKWDPASPQMIFNCSSLRKDGCVTIPKIGAFAMDRKIVPPPGKQLSMAIVEKEPDASYSITFKYK